MKNKTVWPLLCLALAAVMVVLDQLSKWAAMGFFMREKAPGFLEWLQHAPERIPFDAVAVAPFFNLVMVWNYGVSFGIMNDGNDSGALVLVGVALLIVTAFTVWLFRSQSHLQRIAMGLVIGGALGNVIDRLRFGAVIDFLDFYVGPYHWPAFNIADCCVVIGVFLLIIHAMFFEKDLPDSAAVRYQEGKQPEQPQ